MEKQVMGKNAITSIAQKRLKNITIALVPI
jgi:hypothetical protein